MNYGKNIQKQLRKSLLFNIVLCAGMTAMGICTIITNPLIGSLLCGLALVWLLAAVLLYQFQLRELSADILSARFEMGQAQTDLLRNLPIPYVQTTRMGDILWYNESFKDLLGSKGVKKNISQNFSGLYKKNFPQPGISREVHILFGERKYNVKCKNAMANVPSDNPDEGMVQEPVLEFYFFDETQLVEYREAYKGKNLVAGLIYMDNFEEVLENMEEVRQSLLLALVERKVVQYMHDLNAIIKKFEKDKFIFVFEEKNLEILVESKFSLLDEVRGINIGNDLSATLSIGVGVNAPGYLETYESARIAMDLALGRGGDQAVVRDGDTISYYGGKTQKVEKSTRVKARVKAQALREIMLTHDRIFIMGHRIPDADCVGAALGIYRLARTFNKKAYIVMDKESPAIEPIVTEVLRENGDNEEEIFISSDQALNIRDHSSMLVVVDVNRSSMTECPDLVKLEKTIVVLDHHRQTSDTIQNTVLSYVEPYASSTCEMVAEILQYIPDKPKLKAIEADALYSGILVDTDNFVVKAGVRTFEAAAYLRRAGADVTRVRKMFRDDMDSCRKKAEIINNAETYLEEFVIATFNGEDVAGATVIGAKAANSLLDVQGIRGSFVITSLPGWIYISARSIDDLNVQVVMEKLGGGGHMRVAAAQLKNTTIEEARNKLKSLLLSMKEEGDI